MKISWRVWVLVFALSFAMVSILNIEPSFSLLVGLLIISIPFTLTFSNSKYSRTIFLILTAIAIILLVLFSFQKGVLVSSVGEGSQFFNEGLRKGMIITAVDGVSINNIEEYHEQINSIEFDKITKVQIQTNSGEYIAFSNKSPEIVVSDIPKTKIKTGLDLSGGARAILKPVNATLTPNDIADLVSVTSNRLNTFGISDVDVRGVSDLEGNRFLKVEVAGITPEDLKELVGQQGK